MTHRIPPRSPAATYSNQAVPLVFKNGNTSSFQLLSYAGCLQSIELDLGNEVAYRELVGCTKEVLITDRKLSGTVMIEAVALATKNYFTAATSDSSLGNLQFTHGTAAGNTIAVSSSTIDLGDVSYDDQDGITMLSIPVVAVPTTSGNDEVKHRLHLITAWHLSSSSPRPTSGRLASVSLPMAAKYERQSFDAEFNRLPQSRINEIQTEVQARIKAAEKGESC
jgi:hypothetical protein